VGVDAGAWRTDTRRSAVQRLEEDPDDREEAMRDAALDLLRAALAAPGPRGQILNQHIVESHSLDLATHTVSSPLPARQVTLVVAVERRWRTQLTSPICPIKI